VGRFQASLGSDDVGIRGAAGTKSGPGPWKSPNGPLPHGLPSGKHTKNYGKSPFSMGKSTISMVIFNSYVKLPEGMKNGESKV
jgi:hypothetical protein